MDNVNLLKNAIEFAKKNPNAPQSLALRKRIESGMYATEMAQIKQVPFEHRNTAQSVLGAFLDPIIETGAHVGMAIGDLALTGINKISGGALDKYTPEGNLSQALQRAENTPSKVPITGTVIKPVKDLTAENIAGNAVKTVALGVDAPATAGALFLGGDAMSKDESAGEVAVNTIVGALGGKILEHGFNAVAPFIEKAVAKYGAPVIEKLGAYIPDSAKGFMENLASKITPSTDGKILPKVASDVIEKGQKVLNNVIDKPTEKLVSGTENLFKAGYKKAFPTPVPDKAAAQIIQGKTEDLAAAKRTLSTIDTNGVKTYKDLQTKINNEVPTLAKQVDAELLKDPTPHKLKDLTYSIEVGGKPVKNNYVKDAIGELKNFYASTNDVKALAEIKQLEARAKSVGLNYKEVNDLAREHGQAINAFNANGQASSGLSKQAAENTRKGLKLTARQGLSGDEARALDAKLSDLYDTQTLINKQVEKVNTETNKAAPQNPVAKVVRTAIKIADTATGSPLKAISKELGLKSNSMSAMEIEKNLEKNLAALRPKAPSTKVFDLKSNDGIVSHIKENGGISVDPNGNMPTTGYSVSPSKATETKIPIEKFNTKSIEDFKLKFAKELDKPGAHLGAWEDNGNIVLDVSIVEPDIKKAINIAAKGKQDAIWDIVNGEGITVEKPKINKTKKKKQWTKM